MASIRLIPEQEATGKVKEIFEEIKSTLGIDFVPNLYRSMAVKPGFLEANWNKVKAVMIDPGKLDRFTKETIAVAVSAVFAGPACARVAAADGQLDLSSREQGHCRALVW